jgi:hypothetical protein
VLDTAYIIQHSTIQGNVVTLVALIFGSDVSAQDSTRLTHELHYASDEPRTASARHKLSQASVDERLFPEQHLSGSLARGVFPESAEPL